MATNWILIVAIVVLVGCGTSLVLERSLTRILVGFVMLGNGVNLVFLVASGPAGGAPIIGMSGELMTDPLPQAMVLTAIVITLGVTAFGLALAYRAWQLTGHDDVQDDVEDDFVRRRADLDHTSASFDDATGDVPDEEGVDLPSAPTGVTDDDLAAQIVAQAQTEAAQAGHPENETGQTKASGRHTHGSTPTTKEDR